MPLPLRSLIRRLVPRRLRPSTRLMRELAGCCQQRVSSGPFKGMAYVSRAWWSEYFPKLLGTYEKELVPLIEGICNRAPATIVDVGAAEGYYAIGLARRLPAARVFAFEGCEQGRDLFRRLAALNGLDGRIDLRGFCTTDELSALLRGTGLDTAVLLCDCEGYEAILLDPLRVPELSRVEMVVEVHDFLIGGLGDVLRTRFERTHEIRLIREQPRELADFPYPHLIRARRMHGPALAALDERRAPGSYWLHFTPLPTESTFC